MNITEYLNVLFGVKKLPDKIYQDLTGVGGSIKVNPVKSRSAISTTKDVIISAKCQISQLVMKWFEGVNSISLIYKVLGKET